MKVQAFPYAFFEDKFVKIEDAKVSIMTNALQYGTGIFGGIRAYYNAQDNTASLFRVDDHLQRLFNAANILGCPIGDQTEYTKDRLKEIAIELVKRNQPATDAYLRPYAYVGNTELGPNLANTPLSFALYMIALDEYMPLGKGLNLVVSSWRKPTGNAIPPLAKASGAYINSALARKEATDGGYDEAVVLTEDGNVAEGSAENLFIVRDGTIITPPQADGILEGITRRSVLELAEDMGIPIVIRSIPKGELYIANEVFLTGTGCQIAWVEQIDKRIIGTGQIGPITQKLKDKFFGVVRGADQDRAEWRTVVQL